MKKRIFAALLTLVMMLSLLPMNALAATSDPTTDGGDMTFTKTAAGPDNDGNYTITMTAQAKGQTTTTTKVKPMDIVLVLDQSGSMAYDFNGNETGENTARRQYAMKAAVKGFIDTVAAKSQDSKISIVKFAGTASDTVGNTTYKEGGYSYNHSQIVVPLTAVDSAGVKALKDAVSGLKAGGATRVDFGMEKAAEALKASTNEQKVVIVFTDGVPTTASDFSTTVANAAIRAAKGMKDKGVTIYTVGIFNGAKPDEMYGASGFNPNSDGTVNSKWEEEEWGLFPGTDFPKADRPAGNRFLNLVSSNYPSADSIGLKRETFGAGIFHSGISYTVTKNFVRVAEGDYYKTATNASELNNIFTQINQSITKPVNEALNGTTEITDTLSGYFTFATDIPANSVEVYAEKPDGTKRPIDLPNGPNGIDVNGKTVTVKGYDFSKHYKGSDDEETLVIKITVKPDTAATWGETGDYDTNSGNAMVTLPNVSDPIASAVSPQVPVTTYQVTYEVTGGDNNTPAAPVDERYYIAGQKFTVKEKLSCEGYTFTGWTWNNDTYPGGAEATMVTGDVTLRGAWEKNPDPTTYTLTYDANGGTLNPSMTNPVTNIAGGEKVLLDYINQPTHSPQNGKNVIFIGWTRDDTNEKVYANGETLPDIAYDVTFENENIIVHAVWGLDENGDNIPDVLEAKVTYKIENGEWFDSSSADPEATATSEDQVAYIPLYEKKSDGTWTAINTAKLGKTIPTGHRGNRGYSGDGWYKNAENERIEISDATAVTENVTYTFKYVPESKPDAYTVVLHLNGGAYAPAPEGYTTDGGSYSYTLSAATDVVNPDAAALSRAGYEFKGWSLSNTESQTLIGADETFASLYVQQSGLGGTYDRIDLYAVWEEKAPVPETVTIDLSKYFQKDLTVTGDYPYSGGSYTIALKENVVAVISTDAEQSEPAADAYDATATATYAAGEYGVKPFVGELTLKEGWHNYRVWELNPKNETGYDSSEYWISFYVDRLDDGNLAVTAAAPADGDEWMPMTENDHIVFRNSVFTGYRYIPTDPTPSKPALNTDDHYAYVVGYPDGTVRPNGSITRAEAATIFFRLLTDATRSQYWTTTNAYSDVAAGSWYNNAISTMSSAGIVNGYPDGTFRPDAPITRAEMAKMISLFAKLDKTEDRFTDIAGHWAEAYIKLAAGNGWIEGYPDGSFKPQQSITRAETMTMINRVLERVPSTISHLLPYSVMQTYPDCVASDWFYIAVQEATNSHTYERAATEKNGDEQWIALRDNRDWTQLEY